MGRKIGEIFEYNGEWYQCVNGECKDCDFSKDAFYCKYLIERDFCKAQSIFKRLEKVGEPYMLEDKKFQKYRVFKTPYIYHKIDCSWQSFSDPYYISLEIKEDMEEKKLNLKPFDIQKAREGKPVCTRDGRKARIICFDVKGSMYPIIALIEESEGEKLCSYMPNGRSYKNEKECIDNLMMLPEKKEGWVNVYNSLGVVTFSHNPYDTKKEALADAKPKYYVDTVKINWEE